jgi:murein L,D-transpeptidase YcbB/YkuD
MENQVIRPNGLRALSRRRLIMTAAAVPAMVAAPGLLMAENARDDFRVTVKRNYNVQSASPDTRAPTTSQVVSDYTVRPTLDASSQRMMYDAVARYEIIVSRGGWPRIPQTKTIGKGTEATAVDILRQRLATEGYLPRDAARGVTFDDNVEKALINFQRNHGLATDGRLGPKTQEALNVSAFARLETLRANLPRVGAYAQDLGYRYIVVNVPAGQLDAVEGGSLRSRHNVVVGKPDRPTPMLASKVSELNFNPYWNAPVSIVEKDILPKVRKSLAVLEQMNIRIYDGYQGPEVDPTTVDWNSVTADRYHFRQDPGQGNAMASVKINFRNKYAVYMHDTPDKQLFTAAARYFSSGCVRVEKVHVLTSWILREQDNWNRDQIEAVVNSGERVDVEVVDGPQIRFAYLTGWATDDGQVHFRDDIYRLDGTGFILGQPEVFAEPV